MKYQAATRLAVLEEIFWGHAQNHYDDGAQALVDQILREAAEIPHDEDSDRVLMGRKAGALWAKLPPSHNMRAFHMDDRELTHTRAKLIKAMIEGIWHSKASGVAALGKVLLAPLTTIRAEEIALRTALKDAIQQNFQNGRRGNLVAAILARPAEYEKFILAGLVQYLLRTGTSEEIEQILKIA